MTFNHLFGLNGIYTCALGCAHGYGTQAIANLFLRSFRRAGAALMADHELCGKAASMRNNAFLTSL